MGKSSLKFPKINWPQCPQLGAHSDVPESLSIYGYDACRHWILPSSPWWEEEKGIREQLHGNPGLQRQSGCHVDACRKASASLGNQLPGAALMSRLPPPVWVGSTDSSWYSWACCHRIEEGEGSSQTPDQRMAFPFPASHLTSFIQIHRQLPCGSSTVIPNFLGLKHHFWLNFIIFFFVIILPFLHPGKQFKSLKKVIFLSHTGVFPNSREKSYYLWVLYNVPTFFLLLNMHK